MKTNIGLCGFAVSREKYFRAFPVVELQQTFYQPPALRTIRKWHAQSPEGFEYTIKAWQLITHEPKSPTYRRLKMSIPESQEKNYGSFKPTDEVFQAWETTKEIAAVLGARIILFQCPASFQPLEEHTMNMKNFFRTIQRESFVFAWEPRGRWSEEQIESICKELDLIHTVDPFKSRPVYGKLRYYRLHGIGGYRYRYSEEDLKTLKSFIDEKIDTYVLFNNVYMYENALEFKKLF
jgi:uncharacterized protein YecE (DUF72 family)